jgi:hypothetical protein
MLEIIFAIVFGFILGFFVCLLSNKFEYLRVDDAYSIVQTDIISNSLEEKVKFNSKNKNNKNFTFFYLRKMSNYLTHFKIK